MQPRSRELDIGPARWRALVCVGLVALLLTINVAGFLHFHSAATNDPCAICRVIHAPAPAGENPTLLISLLPVTGSAIPELDALPLDPRLVHIAPRAPPTI